jgi:hypothetical protein
MKKVKEGVIDESKAQRREMRYIGKECEERRGAVCEARMKTGSGEAGKEGRTRNIHSIRRRIIFLPSHLYDGVPQFHAHHAGRTSGPEIMNWETAVNRLWYVTKR